MSKFFNKKVKECDVLEQFRVFHNIIRLYLTFRVLRVQKKNFFTIILHTYIATFVTRFRLVRYTDFKYRTNLH